tara:strand:+ start:421 stop:1095 length:675 start_codon:yes stop_codon:yes gene_type:complete
MDFLNEVELDDTAKQKLTDQFNSTLETKLQEKLDAEVAGLKAKNDELLSEKKAAQKAKEELDAKARTEKEEIAKKQNDFQQLYESQKEEADSLRSKIQEMNQQVQRQTITGEASRIAAILTKDAAKAKLLEKEISQRLTLVENEIRVTDDSGQLTVSTLDDLTTQIRGNYPFLIDGIQSQGGGAARSHGGADVGNKEISRSQFDSMSQNQRGKFFREGGKIIDD